MKRFQDSKLQIVLFILLFVFVILLITACNNEMPDESYPEPNRGIALKNISLVYKQQFDTQLNKIRINMLSASNQSSGRNLGSDQVRDYLVEAYDNSDVGDYLLVISSVDEDGIVQRSYPLKYDTTLAGEDRSTSNVFQDVENNILASISKVSFVDSSSYFDYLVPVIENSLFSGCIWSSVSLDSLTRRSFAYTSVTSSEEEAVFLIDSEGYVIFDKNPLLLGSVFSNEGIDQADTTRLSEKILVDETGYSWYMSDDSPGAGNTGGERLIGWSRLFIEDKYWTIAVTEPVEIDSLQ